MKKSIFAVVIGTMFSIFTETASAQIVTANSLTASKETFLFNAEGNIASYKSAADFNKAGFKASRTLSKQFKNQENVKWTAENKLLSASFKSDGVQTYSVYNKNGHWLRNMMVYTGEKMPRRILQQVRAGEYRYYDITQIQEVQEPGITFYVAHIENSKGFKKLCVYQNEITVIEEYDK